MARTVYDAITTKTDRLDLTKRAAPYLHTIEPGRVLGYVRRGNKTAGTWLVRKDVGRTDKGHPIRRRVSLGTADDYGTANGKNILDFNQARTKAQGMVITRDGAEKKRGAMTLWDVCEQHLTFSGKNDDKTLRQKTAAYNALRHNLLGMNTDSKVREGVTVITNATIKLADLPKGPWALHRDMTVASLTSELLFALRSQWIDAEQSSRSRATALRRWTDIRSALEQAFLKKSNAVLSPAAWQTVPRMKQKFSTRVLHFRDDESEAILAYIRKLDTYAADYLEAIYRFGTRPGGEVFNLRVRHFNPDQRTLAIQARSETIETKDIDGRHIGIPKSAVAFLNRVIDGRKSSEFIFTKDGTNQWDDDAARRIKPMFIAAIREVQGDEAIDGSDAIPMKDIVPYAFRHTFISRRAARGMPAKAIATHCGTSEWMIQKTYAHAFPSETQQWLDDTDVKVQLKVVKSIAA